MGYNAAYSDKLINCCIIKIPMQQRSRNQREKEAQPPNYLAEGLAPTEILKIFNYS